MPGFIEQLGMQAAGNTLGAGMGLILGGIERKKQLQQQQKLQNMQIAGQQQMGIFNREQQMKLWEDTNYSAQMEQLKKAGLNPALLYGSGGGPGGTTATQGGNVSGAQARQGGEAAAMGMQMGQAAMMTAQIELMKAQTEKTKAEATAIPINVEKTGQEIINLKTQNALDEIEKSFQQDTYKNRESMINLGLSKLIEEVKIIENDRQISDETKGNQIKIIAQELANKVLTGLNLEKQNAKSEKETGMIEKQIRAIEQQININKLDEDAAKAGVNPKAGTLLKTGYNIITIIKNILGL